MLLIMQTERNIVTYFAKAPFTQLVCRDPLQLKKKKKKEKRI